MVLRSPVDILSFGLSNSILASSNLTSSWKISRATDGWTGGSQSDLTDVERLRFVFYSVKHILKSYSSRKLSKIGEN